MRRTGRVLGAALVAAGFILALLAASPASASHVISYSKTDQKCRSTIAKLFDRSVVTATKVTATCHKNRNSGKLAPGTNCNDLSQADTGKFQKMTDKLAAGITKSCITPGATHLLLDEFTSCPEPCATSTGVANPLADFSEVGDCLACLASEIASERSSDMLGLPTLPLSTDEQKCHASISKGYGKRLKTALKARTKCQQGEDAAHNTDLQPCDTSDPNGAIANATVVAESTLETACVGVDVAALDSCDTSLAGLETCLAAADDTSIGRAFTSSYELAPTICPVSITLTTYAGAGADGSTTLTRVDSGWRGLGHRQDLVDQFQYDLAVSCPNTEPPCGTCSITGYVDSVAQPGAFIRCLEDTRKTCSNAFGTDPVCPGSQACAVYMGPPLPLNASLTPVCVVTRAEADAGGTVDVETGNLHMDLSARAQVWSGIGQLQPCPVCTGDTTPRDGVRDGTCVGGLSNGLSCDVQGFDATFGNTSMDCVPNSGNISGAGLRIEPAFDTGAQSMPFGTKCDNPLNGYDCACAVCSNDVSQPCNANSDCVSPGTCTAKGDGPNRQPNGCYDLNCVDIGDDLGECANANSDVHYCDGQLRANGRGILICDPLNGDADCDVYASSCQGGDCGHCTLTEKLTCFLNPIAVSGSADPESPVVGAVYCVPPTNSAGVNSGTGLPGPSRSTVQLDLHRNY